ncbi:chalcone isomerase family protein [Achromobacter seleniivolatilans]|uniref:Chalcone isomerase family protein n=1 Tax=Achromobacter seleniivolatilans TaxID=3047478 RepID=A0ABY9M288_9BURK|nr:chalcone isomerase family protein [Achromobacter sp. R39]WMD20308.1 chalcone isomerase family protein [Achromobacter sp. R39]
MSNSSEAALPAALLDAHPAQWRLVGKGLFTWSVFRLYHAYLYAPAASASTPFNLDGDFALMLRYLRNIPGEQIVTTSTQEIARLTDTSTASLAEWTESMTRIFPDVASGDRLTGLFLRGQGVGFYSGDTLAGEIDSPAFARAFAAIWLDPRTRSPALRAGLLGL